MAAGRKKSLYGNGIGHFRSMSMKLSPWVEDTEIFSLSLLLSL